MSKLTTKGRDQVKRENFALPSQRRYPIQDIEHGRAALRMVAAHGSEAEKTTVRTAVYRKYPSLKNSDTMNRAIRKSTGRK